MNNKNKLLVVSLCVVGLSSCSSMFEESGYSSYQGYSYDQSVVQDGQMQPGAYGEQVEKKGVEVPNSYHVGVNRAPVSPKNVDKNWVNSQNPMGYTIEVADDEKPSNVASRLQQMPATDRKAEVKYKKGGKTYYKGVYGTYNSYQDAKKAYDALPADVKANARVKNWGSVQGGSSR